MTTTTSPKAGALVYAPLGLALEAKDSAQAGRAQRGRVALTRLAARSRRRGQSGRSLVDELRTGVEASSRRIRGDPRRRERAGPTPADRVRHTHRRRGDHVLSDLDDEQLDTIEAFEKANATAQRCSIASGNAGAVQVAARIAIAGTSASWAHGRGGDHRTRHSVEERWSQTAARVAPLDAGPDTRIRTPT